MGDVGDGDLGGEPIAVHGAGAGFLLVGSSGFDPGGEVVVRIWPENGAWCVGIGGLPFAAASANLPGAQVAVDLTGDLGGGCEFTDVEPVVAHSGVLHALAVAVAVVSGLVNDVFAVADGELEVADAAGDLEEGGVLGHILF